MITIAKTLAYMCALPAIGFVPPAEPGVASMAQMWKAAEICRVQSPNTPCLKSFFVRIKPGTVEAAGQYEAAWECAAPEQVPL